MGAEMNRYNMVNGANGSMSCAPADLIPLLDAAALQVVSAAVCLRVSLQTA